MPRGTAHSVTGLLVTDGHGFALDVDGGGRWRLDVRDDRVAARLAGLSCHRDRPTRRVRSARGRCDQAAMTRPSGPDVDPSRPGGLGCDS